MKFGVSSLALAADPDDASSPAFERVAGWGFDGIELHVDEPRELHVYRRMRRRLTALGLDVTVADRGLWREGDEARLRRLVDVCVVLDARLLCGAFAVADDRAGVTSLARVASYADRFGVQLAAGGRPGSSVTVAQTARRVDAVCARNLGLVYNTCQAHVEESSVGGAVLCAGARIRHVQIADNDGAAAGRGQVRWAETFASLDAIRYDGWYVVAAKPGANAEAGAIIGLRFLRAHRS